MFNKLSIRQLILAGIWLATLWTSAAATDTYRIVRIETTAVTAHLKRTVATVQVGANPLNRFLIHRVAKNAPSESLRGSILLLPPLGSGFQNYEVGENNDYNNSFVAFFAQRNFAVWGYSQRAQGLAAGACESGSVDCAAMADWGLQTIVDDVAFIQRMISQVDPCHEVIVGGLSLGSIAALAVINATPQAYAGALLIDGTLYDTDPQVRAINHNFCQQFDALLAQGVFYDGQQLPGFKLVAQLATVAPNDPSPLPGFPPGLTNHQVFVAAMSTPQISPAFPRPDFFNAAGDALQDRLFFADDALIRANVAQFVDYIALRTLRDINCGLAGDGAFTGRLGQFTGAVYISASGHGFGSAMLDTAALLTGATVTTDFIAPFGHVDAYFAVDHRQRLEQPILAWLEGVVAR
jgi:pimeloyl-ACP methyl ester carboxylesterase